MRFIPRLATSAGVAAVVLWASVAALSGQTAGIVDIRVGEHRDYDRLVMELAGPVAVLRHASEPGGEVIFEVEARPLLAHQTLDTALRRLGHVQIDATERGALIRVAPRPCRVRAFLLHGPERLVIDFGDPDLEPFAIPQGTEAVPIFEPPVEAEEPEPGPGEGVAEVSEPEAVTPTEEPNRPQAEAIPEPASTPAPGPPPEATELPPEAEPPPAEVQSAPQLPGMEKHSTLWSVGLAVLFAVLLGTAGIFAVRLWRRIPPNPTDPEGTLVGEELPGREIPSDTIMPEEFESAGDRLGVLEKRIDDEVRARMHLEERVIQIQEELKVLRDRFQRVARAKERQGPGP